MKLLTSFAKVFANCVYDASLNKVMFNPFKFYDTTMQDTSAYCLKYQLFLQSGINLICNPCQLTAKEYKSVVDALEQYQFLAGKEAAPLEKFKNLVKLSADDVNGIEQDI